MTKLRMVYGTGCWFFGILCGIGHLITELSPPPPAKVEMMLLLQGVPLNFAGTQTDAGTLTFGVSVVLGLMLLAYGAINLMILRDTPMPMLPKRSFQMANILFSLAAFVLAWNYLFSVPTVLTGIAFICFVVCYVMGRDASAAPQST